MANQIRQASGESGQVRKLFAYGFDALGFQTPPQHIPLGDGIAVEFLRMDDPRRLGAVDGAIIPQGIFEKIEYGNDMFGDPVATVHIEHSLLLERQKQVLNLFREGKWICFLVRDIVDSVPGGGYHQREINDTDLCKRILNSLGITDHERQSVDGLSVISTKYDEFRPYMRDYGIANTTFTVPYGIDVELKTLADANSRIVAFEAKRAFFFLPFHTTRKDVETAKSIVQEIARGILDYRQKRVVEIPAWADEFQFEAEKQLGSEVADLLERANKSQAEMQTWREYKLIVNTSGDFLRDSIVSLLRRFFNVSVSAEEEFIEDARIIDENGATLAFVETKGTKGGVKREFINQVDSHRKRRGLSPSVPGVLIINNEMSLSGVNKRLTTKVPADQIKHAKNLNVLIIRTIDLLFLMKHLEPAEDRKQKLLELLRLGGGWLNARPDGYNLVHE